MYEVGPMIVRCCKECPFFQTILLALFANKPNSGLCGYDGVRDAKALETLGLPPGPERDIAKASADRRMIVRDNTTIPDQCPLHTKDIVLTLDGGD
jgi:hypothetical protein